MNQTTNTRQEGDVIILDLRGRIVLGEESAAFRERICDLLAEGDRKILLSLAGVNYIDSTDLAQLVGAQSSDCLCRSKEFFRLGPQHHC